MTDRSHLSARLLIGDAAATNPLALRSASRPFGCLRGPMEPASDGGKSTLFALRSRTRYLGRERAIDATGMPC